MSVGAECFLLVSFGNLKTVGSCIDRLTVGRIILEGRPGAAIV